MTAFNVVRFRVKPGREAEFLEAQKKAHMDFAGFRHFAIIKTGDRTYCVIGIYELVVLELTCLRLRVKKVNIAAAVWPDANTCEAAFTFDPDLNPAVSYNGSLRARQLGICKPALQL